MHFPPVRASGYPYAGVLSLRKPVNNTASQQAADRTLPTINCCPSGPGTGPDITERKANYSLININIMNSLFLYHNGENLNDRSDTHIQADSQPVHSMSEGSEFLDDIIRMKEMPLIFSEEKIDAGYTRNQL
jgi:hypothetical protein